ncbi:MAG: STAS/SEC14 domain-containing protein [Paracoccaceae bacterium]
MPLFTSGSVTQIATTDPKVYAFRITGHVDDDTSEELAKFMNTAFDTHDGKVDMLLDMTFFSGSDWDSFLDGDVITSRFRALKHVHRYAVVGAPAGAARMISMMDKIIPVEARAFDDLEAAWAFVGAEPVTE